MIHNLVCDSCKTEFNVDDEKLLKVTEGDIEVQYFECPKCERKYIVFTTNERMRELVEKRRLLAAQIRLSEKDAKAQGRTTQAKNGACSYRTKDSIRRK